MLTFRQKILKLSEEQLYLQCKICQKEFPKFDQRGFRNAGFTAHQNRCIEREYMLSHPVLEQQLSSPRQRLLLPAPSSSTSTLMNSSSRSKSSSPVLEQQQQQLQRYQQQQYQQQLQHQVQQQFHQQVSQTHYDHANVFIQAPTGSFLISNNEQQQQIVQEEGIDLSLFSHVNYSYPATAATTVTTTTGAPALPPVEMIFPITHFEYCDPEFGLHQSSCLLLAEFLRQGSNMQ